MRDGLQAQLPPAAQRAHARQGAEEAGEAPAPRGGGRQTPGRARRRAAGGAGGRPRDRGRERLTRGESTWPAAESRWSPTRAPSCSTSSTRTVPLLATTCFL